MRKGGLYQQSVACQVVGKIRDTSGYGPDQLTETAETGGIRVHIKTYNNTYFAEMQPDGCAAAAVISPTIIYTVKLPSLT